VHDKNTGNLRRDLCRDSSPSWPASVIIVDAMTPKRLDSFARAAMLGLLAASQSACTSSESGGEEVNDANGSPDETSLLDELDSSADGVTSGEGNLYNSSTGGDGGGGGAPAEGVTSTKVIADLTLTKFTELCDAEGGVVETHATCGGVVTGPGFSYDSDVDEFTEHTCAGFNTCTGFSCVLD